MGEHQVDAVSAAMLSMYVANRFGNEVLQGHAQEFTAVVTEQHLGASIRQHDAAAVFDDDHTIR